MGLIQQGFGANVSGAIGDFFKNIFAPKPTPQGTATANAALDYYNNPASQLPATYQARPNDTDLNSVANQFNVPLQQLVDSNDGAKTLPPVGSFMALKPQGSPQQYLGSERGQTTLAGQGGLPSLFNQSTQQTQTTRGLTSDDRPRLVGSTFAIQQQLNSGYTPSAIPSSIVGNLINPNTGLPVTEADLVAGGMILNSATGQWQSGKSAASAGPRPDLIAQGYTFDGYSYHAPPGQDPYSQVKSVYYSKSAGYVTPEIAALKNKKRAQRAQEVVAPILLDPNNAADTAQTVLELRLGSG